MIWNTVCMNYRRIAYQWGEIALLVIFKKKHETTIQSSGKNIPILKSIRSPSDTVI